MMDLVLTVDSLIERLGQARSRGGVVVLHVRGLGDFALTTTYDRTRRPTRKIRDEGRFELTAQELNDREAMQRERMRIAGARRKEES